MQVSFIIPLYNCRPLTEAMFASLQATLPAGLACEIIFVDDGSTDGTREWLAGLGTVAGPPPTGTAIRVLLNDRNVGYAAANNRGAAVATGRLLALLNNDLILLPHWLESMLAAHAALRRRAGAVGNIQLDARSGLVDHAGLVVNLTGKPVHVRAPPAAFYRRLRPVRAVPAVTGACLLVERALWDELGGLDEAFVNGGEDIDFCFRARAAGRVNAVALRSIVRHHVSSSPGRKARDEQNSYLLARRWQTELIAAADDGARTWCREYLARALYIPESAEYRVALMAVAFLAHLRRRPPLEAVSAVEKGLQREFTRWESMFAPSEKSRTDPS